MNGSHPYGRSRLTAGLSIVACLFSACGGQSAPTSTPASVATESEPSEGGESDAIDAALTGSHRSAKNRDRDPYRHPKETLRFMGLTPDMTVVELAPGGGWYTEVLAGVLCEHGGTLYAAVPSLEGPSAKYAQAFHDRVARDPDVFDCVQTVTLEPPAQVSLGPEGQADMVLTFRSTHGWINRGQAETIYAEAFKALKPGGVFGVVQHRAPEGSDATETVKQGYVPQAKVIALAEGAGFRLADSSEINANPKDTKDHPEGVWTLPPTLRLGEKPEYLAIGESDRMTLKFVKPETASTP